MKLISYLIGGKNSRTVDEFDRPINGVGYQNFNRPSMSLMLKDEDLGRNRDRGYRASLTEPDLHKILDRIFNPIDILTLGQISAGNFQDDAALRFYGRVAKSVGLPLNKFIARVDERDYFCLATSLDHAKAQFNKLFKDRVSAVVFAEEFNYE